MRIYHRTSANTAVGMPLWLAFFVYSIAFAFVAAVLAFLVALTLLVALVIAIDGLCQWAQNKPRRLFFRQWVNFLARVGGEKDFELFEEEPVTVIERHDGLQADEPTPPVCWV